MCDDDHVMSIAHRGSEAGMISCTGRAMLCLAREWGLFLFAFVAADACMYAARGLNASSCQDGGAAVVVVVGMWTRSVVSML